MNWNLKLIVTLFIVFCGLEGHSQRDILKSTLSEYGSQMTFERAWTDDEYIVVHAQGTINKLTGQVFLLIHPDHGIVSSYVMEKQSQVRGLEIISANGDEFTVFYKDIDKSKTRYYSLTFSKSSKEVHKQEISDAVNRIEKESFFSVRKDGVYLFASITKDKAKFAFREITKDGTDRIGYLFDMPETLSKYIGSNKFSGSSRHIQTPVYVNENTVYLIGRDFKSHAKDQILNIFECDLTTQQIKINSFTQAGIHGSVSASFVDDRLFLMKINPAQIQLEILNYPSFKQEKIFTITKQTPEIPFKSSHTMEMKYTAGLYFSGRNRHFTDMEAGGQSTIKTINSIGMGDAFVRTQKTANGNILIMTGSVEEIILTNAVERTESYFFGCLDANSLEKCSTSTEKSRFENLTNYLKKIRDEKPEYGEFGTKRTFAIFNLKDSGEIVIKEF